ncbi:MAG: hypothetical protein AAGB12_14260 [Pseudomonadota bacterium]
MNIPQNQTIYYFLKFFQNIFLSLWFFIFSLAIYAEENADSNIWDMDLGEILAIKLSVASSFEETELESGSTVALVEREQWEQYGANMIPEALGHLPGTLILPFAWGGFAMPIRGFASNLSGTGIAGVLDGIPMNSLRSGSFLTARLFQADAFHGVISMRSHFNEVDSFDITGTVNSEDLWQVSARGSKHFDAQQSIHGAISHIEQDNRNTPYQYTDPFTQMREAATRPDGYDGLTSLIKWHLNIHEHLKIEVAAYYLDTYSSGSNSGGQALSGNSILRERDVSTSDDTRSIFRANLGWELPYSMALQAKIYHWEDSVHITTDFINFPAFGVKASTISEENSTGVDLTVLQRENSLNTQ